MSFFFFKEPVAASCCKLHLKTSFLTLQVQKTNYYDVVFVQHVHGDAVTMLHATHLQTDKTKVFFNDLILFNLMYIYMCIVLTMMYIL